MQTNVGRNGQIIWIWENTWDQALMAYPIHGNMQVINLVGLIE